MRQRFLVSRVGSGGTLNVGSTDFSEEGRCSSSSSVETHSEVVCRHILSVNSGSMEVKVRFTQPCSTLKKAKDRVM